MIPKVCENAVRRFYGDLQKHDALKPEAESGLHLGRGKIDEPFVPAKKHTLHVRL